MDSTNNLQDGAGIGIEKTILQAGARRHSSTFGNAETPPQRLITGDEWSLTMRDQFHFHPTVARVLSWRRTCRYDAMDCQRIRRRATAALISADASRGLISRLALFVKALADCFPNPLRSAVTVGELGFDAIFELFVHWHRDVFASHTGTVWPRQHKCVCHYSQWCCGVVSSCVPNRLPQWLSGGSVYGRMPHE